MKHRMLVVHRWCWWRGHPAIACERVRDGPDSGIRHTGRSGEATERAADPMGDPDLQGIWTLNDMHGVPLERPAGHRRQECS